jgi:biopolymer transport protein ExbB
MTIAPLLAQAAADADAVSLFEAFFIQRHPVTKELELLGSLIIWFLLALSAVCLGLLGSMALDNRRSNIIPADLPDRAGELLGGKRYDEAMELARSGPSDAAAILGAALEEAPMGHEAMLHAADQRAEELMLRRFRRIEPLNIIGNVAPMIGLFGTVYGMILAFREIVAAGGAPDPVGLAAGIGTALTTTFWGLVVAIPALAGYALIRNAIDGHTLEAARTVEQLIARFRPGPGAAGGGGGKKRGTKGARGSAEHAKT